MSELSPWQRVQIARDSKRQKSQDLIHLLFDDFIELSGDRCFGEDKAILGGIGMFHGMPVTILAQSKGKSVEENIEKNFGMVSPEGYRKVYRLAKQAEKFKRPIITIVDTAGAYPGKGAEQRGQAQAIAQCLQTFSDLETVVICIVLSEGGSGGALALSVADRIVMFENAIYSILSPEGFASILWKDETKAKEASEVMKLTSKDLLDMKIVDQIIYEVEDGIQNDLGTSIAQLDHYLVKELEELNKKRIKTLLQQRYEKFRAIGV